MNLRAADQDFRQDLIVCFSHLRWDFVFQRPQHLLTRAAKSFKVLFIEEPISEEVEYPRLRLSPRDGVLVATPVMRDVGGGWDSAVQQMVHRLIDDYSYDRLILWYYTPMALGASQNLPANVVVYDCMDELSAFRFAPADLLAREAALLTKADVVYTGGLSLYEAKRPQHANVHCFPSSVDEAHFARAKDRLHDPEDQSGIAFPRIGYFGVIDERLDLALLAGLARARPDWQFVMVGPLAKISAQDLPRERNIHWLGAKPYTSLPDYLGGWQAGLMPFALNEATRFISPTKTPEYLSAGVPVVSTPVADVVRSYGGSGLVCIGSTTDELIDAIERQMARPRDAFVADVDTALSGNSWDNTWAAMRGAILDAAAARSDGIEQLLQVRGVVHV